MKLNFTGLAIRPDNQDLLAEIQDTLGYSLEECDQTYGIEVLETVTDKDTCFIYFSENGALAIVNEAKVAPLFYREQYFQASFKIDEISGLFKLEFVENEGYANKLSLSEESGIKKVDESYFFDIDEIDSNRSDSLTTIKSAVNFVLGEDIWDNKQIIFRRFTKKSCLRVRIDGHIKHVYSESEKFLLPIYNQKDLGKVISLSHDLSESVELNFDIEDEIKTYFAGIHSYKDKYIGISVVDVGTQATYPFTVQNVYLSMADKSGNLISKEYLCEGMYQLKSVIYDKYLIIVCLDYNRKNCIIKYDLETNKLTRADIDFCALNEWGANVVLSNFKIMIIRDKIWIMSKDTNDIRIMDSDVVSFSSTNADYTRENRFNAKDFWSVNAFELKGDPIIFEYTSTENVGVLYYGEEKIYRRYLHLRLLKLSKSGDKISEEVFTHDLISIHYKLDVIAKENLIIIRIIYDRRNIGYLDIYDTELQLIESQDWDPKLDRPIRIYGDYLYMFNIDTIHRRKLFQNKQVNG